MHFQTLVNLFTALLPAHIHIPYFQW
jgi:hypothetical protein